MSSQGTATKQLEKRSWCKSLKLKLVSKIGSQGTATKQLERSSWCKSLKLKLVSKIGSSFTSKSNIDALVIRTFWEGQVGKGTVGGSVIWKVGSGSDFSEYPDTDPCPVPGLTKYVLLFLVLKQSQIAFLATILF